MDGILSPQLAANALTTLETVKEMMGIPAEESDPQVDNVLIRLINAASAWVETMTERKLGKNDYRQKCRGTGSQELVLKHYPIVSVQSVTEIGSGKVLPPESYDFDEKGDIGVLYREEGWPYRGYPGGLSGDYLAPQRYLLVEYTAGYVLPRMQLQIAPVPFLLTWRALFGNGRTGIPTAHKRRTGPCSLLYFGCFLDI